MIGEQRYELVLAIKPFSRGYAFALFEGPLSPIDWGMKEILGGNRNARGLDSVRALIKRTGPEVVVLEDLSTSFARRSRRIKRLQALIANHAEGESIDIRQIGRKQILEYFKAVGATTRYEIAQVIAARIPPFENKLPRARKTWESEDPRLVLFDAISLTLIQYCISGTSVSLID